MYRRDKKNCVFVYICVFVLVKLLVNVCVIKLLGKMKYCLKNVKIIFIWRRYFLKLMYIICD